MKLSIIDLLRKLIYRKSEWFPVVDPDGRVTGTAPRSVCHNGRSMLLHPVVHLHLVNSKGEIYLQKRSPLKDIQPGKWDTSVGGHMAPGESPVEALIREAKEEAGIEGFSYFFLVNYIWSSDRERELVHSFGSLCDLTPQPDMAEAVDGRFWSWAEIEENIGKNIFTPNFEYEFPLIKEKLIKNPTLRD